MTPPSMPLFALLKFLPLLICESGSHLPVCLSDDLMHALAGVAPDISQLQGCLIDDRRDLRDLLWSEIEFGAHSVLHQRADPLWSVQFKEMMPRI